MKICSLPKHENLTTCKNIVEKSRNCSSGAISPLFHNIFNISLTSRVQLRVHIYLLNVVNRISFSSILQIWYIGTDISKYFRKSLEFEITRVDCIYINLVNLSWRMKCLFLRIMEPLRMQSLPDTVNSDQAARIICVFIGSTCQNPRFLMLQLTCLNSFYSQMT